MRMRVRIAGVAAGAGLALSAITVARADCRPGRNGERSEACSHRAYLSVMAHDPTPTRTRTPTPLPATATPLPSPTPKPPPWARYGAEQVIGAWRSAGLEVGPVDRQTEELPTACDWWTMEVPSLGEGRGGIVTACATPDLLTETRDWYEFVCALMGPDDCPWRFERANVFVSFARPLAHDRMQQYKAVLDAMP